MTIGRRSILALFAATAVLASGAPLFAQGKVTYSLALDSVMFGSVQVMMRIEGAGSGPLEVALPAWTFDEYQLNKSYEELGSLQATDGAGKRVPTTVLGSRGWRIDRKGGGEIVASYKVARLRPDLHVNGYFTKNAALLEIPKICLYVKGMTALPCVLQIEKPEHWQLVSELAQGPTEDSYVAESFDRLADSATLVGEFALDRVVAAGVEHLLALDHRGDDGVIDTKPLKKTVKKIVEAAAEIMGPAPFKRYLFVLLPGVDGALDHPNSSVIGLGKEDRTADPSAPIERGAVEYLQAWNGKRFRPKELGPFEWSKENRTRSLWMTEGGSEYLALLVLMRAKLLDREKAFIRLTGRILDHRNHHLSERISPEDASWRMWDRLGDANLGIDVKLSGMLLAFLIDVRLRHASKGKTGLPELVRMGLDRYGGKEGYTEKQLEAFAKETGGAALGTFFDNHVRKAKRLPWNEILQLAGLRFEWFEWNVRDPLLRGVMRNGVLVVGPLETNSALYIAGLRPGDELMYVNQVKVKKPADVDRVLAKLKPRQKLRLDVRHNKKHRGIRLSLEDDTILVIPVEMVNNLIIIKSVPDGPLKDAGIKVGDNLEKVDKRRITQTEDVVESLRRVRKGKVLLTIRRGGKRTRIKVKAPARVFWRGNLDKDEKASPEAREIRKGLLGE